MNEDERNGAPAVISPGQAGVATRGTRSNVLPVAADNESAFAACYARNYERFKRYALGELRDADGAEEVVESTLVALWQRHLIGAGNRFVDLDPLAFRMLKLRIGNQNRYRPRATRPRSRFSALSAWARRATRLVVPGKASQATADLAGVVDAALDDMRPRCREIFLLRREAGMSFKEIASLCGTGPRSVSALMHRAQCVLREHVHRAGFGAAARRLAADSARWKIAEFNREPDLYESQEAIIERDGNPDSALLSDYIAGELPAEQMADVAGRLERDSEFHELAEPLLMAWSVPSHSKPVTHDEVLRSWLQVRRRAGLPDIPGVMVPPVAVAPTRAVSSPASSPTAAGLHGEVQSLLSALAATLEAEPARAAEFFTDDASIVAGGKQFAGGAQIARYWRDVANAGSWQAQLTEVGGEGSSPWARGRAVPGASGEPAADFVAVLKRRGDRLCVYVLMFAGSATR